MPEEIENIAECARTVTVLKKRRAVEKIEQSDPQKSGNPNLPAHGP